MAEANQTIQMQREMAFQESLGVKSALYKVLPQRITKEDLRKQTAIQLPQYNIYLVTDTGTYGLNDIAELAMLLKININGEDMEEIANKHTIRHTYDILIGENYEKEFEEYRKQFI